MDSKKEALLRLVQQTDRGLKTTAELNKAIFAAIARLEELNPTPHPTTAPQLLDGNWELLFTTSQALLGFGRLAKLGKIYQCIRCQNSALYNIAELYSLPLLEGLVSVSAKFVVTSAQRVEVKFQRSIIGLQRWLNYNSTAQGVDDFVNFLETERPARAIDIRISREQTGWLEITYLDTDLRIGRGNEGNVFVLQKVNVLKL
jgi:hypothetical protein